MLMFVYRFDPFEFWVDTKGNIKKGDAERLSEIIAKYSVWCLSIVVHMPNDLFSATVEEMEALVKKACASATKKSMYWMKGRYYFGYEYKDGRFIIKVCKRGGINEWD